MFTVNSQYKNTNINNRYAAVGLFLTQYKSKRNSLVDHMLKYFVINKILFY